VASTNQTTTPNASTTGRVSHSGEQIVSAFRHRLLLQPHGVEGLGALVEHRDSVEALLGGDA
jgi:hypothetical protein